MDILLNMARDDRKVCAVLSDMSLADFTMYKAVYDINIDKSRYNRVLLIKSLTLGSSENLDLLDELFENIVSIANSRKIAFIAELGFCDSSFVMFYSNHGFDMVFSSNGSSIMVYSGIDSYI